MAKPTYFLLVEDDPNDAFFVEREFKQAPAYLGLRIVTDGRNAVRYLRGEGQYADRAKFPVPNVILLDLKMPGMSGFDFLEWLRSEAATEQRVIPVVVMSSSPLQEDIKRAYALGVNSYMTKPIEWTRFRDRIRMLGIYWSEHAETPEASAK
ncbi:MAG TPA: response regulator [Verrucomicrobiae bacterium]|nr:response regulator [Verrucomicrobiae bacterium]